MSSNKVLNSALAFQGFNFLESVDVVSEKAKSFSVALPLRTTRAKTARMAYTKVFKKNVLFNELSNDIKVVILETSEPVIRPEIYALATLGRDEPDHELKGSTREELRASLKLALQQMPG